MAPAPGTSASTAPSVMGEKFAKVKLHLLDDKRYKSGDMVKTPD